MTSGSRAQQAVCHKGEVASVTVQSSGAKGPPASPPPCRVEVLQRCISRQQHVRSYFANPYGTSNLRKCITMNQARSEEGTPEQALAPQTLPHNTARPQSDTSHVHTLGSDGEGSKGWGDNKRDPGAT
ncbi:hypothetical protein ERJ75_000468500 [Trypanosoma vivax]|nr:hypothetical protein TRVL_07081 [Trypanosoma vivax]KAH8616536.1 hypothetical protein ERJ75_000468500 [Trypanosoma vivax]